MEEGLRGEGGLSARRLEKVLLEKTPEIIVVH